MGADANKAAVQGWFAALAKGDGGPLVEAMDDDISWTIMGRSSWLGTFRGKAELRRDHLRPLFGRFAGDYRNHAHRFIAEDDTVVVLCRGQATLAERGTFDNDYGPESTANLRELIEDRMLVCHLDGTTAGSSNRRSGSVTSATSTSGLHQVLTGHACDCPANSGGRFAEAEATARADGRDLSAIYPLPGYC